jgi:hypothetical protein
MPSARCTSSGQVNRVAATIAMATMTAAGCSEESSQSLSREQATAEAVISSETPWIGLAEDVAPADWLVRRKAARGGPNDGVAAVRVSDILERASRRFGDSARMVANRAVQLEAMLAGMGIDEEASDLIDQLTHALEGGKPTGRFSAMCQYYYNLRQQGLDCEQALAALKARYGAGA